MDLLYYYPVNQPLPLPHWGQFTDLDIRFYGDRYPNYAKWQKVYAALSKGFTIQTFENSLSNRWQLTWPPFYMNADVTLLQKTSTNYIVQVVVTDQKTNLPVPGASVSINSGAGARKAATGADGTVKITYRPCLEPDTKMPRECSGLVRKDRCQDILFNTPLS